MPKNPLDQAIDAVEKVQKIHSKAESIRQSFDTMDPLAAATSVLDKITNKVNEIDMLNARTRRRVRRVPPQNK